MININPAITPNVLSSVMSHTPDIVMIAPVKIMRFMCLCQPAILEKAEIASRRLQIRLEGFYDLVSCLSHLQV